MSSKGCHDASSRRPWWRQQFGTRSSGPPPAICAHEDARPGTQCRDRAWQIDLVALDAGCVVFVEVRSTADTDVARPEKSVSPDKQRGG
ncbi:MAG: YraN family protein [Gemmataceae bacterium]